MVRSPTPAACNIRANNERPPSLERVVNEHRQTVSLAMAVRLIGRIGAVVLGATLLACSQPPQWDRCFVREQESLDFGSVPVGASRTQTIAVWTPIDADLSIEIMTSFADLTADEGQKVFRGTTEIPLRWSPRALGPLSAEVRLRQADGACSQVTTLTGIAEDSISADAAVSFGYVPPGTKHWGTLELSNAASTEVTGEVTLTGGAFMVADGGTVTIPGRGKYSARIAFAPSLLGHYSGAVTFAVGPTVLAAAELRGEGGGPRLGVAPDPLDFGIVMYRPASPKKQVVRRVLRLSNIGDLGADGGAPRLFLPTPLPRVDGLAIQRGFRVEGINGYDPIQGLVPGGPSASVSVSLLPDEIGDFSHTLTVESNVAGPASAVGVTASSRIVPSSDIAIEAALNDAGQMDFGSVANGAIASRAVTFRIQGPVSDSYGLVNNIRVVDDAGVFSVLGSPTHVELFGADAGMVVIEAADSTFISGSVTGELRFDSTTLGLTEHTIPLAATLP